MCINGEATRNDLSHFKLPEISFADLEVGSSTAHSTLNKVLSSEGIISIVGIPSFAGARSELLSDLVSCPSMSASSKVEMQDGTVRHSIFGETESLFELPTPHSKCPLFGTKLQIFRGILDVVGDALTHQLGSLCGSVDLQSVPTPSNLNTTASPLQDVIQAGKKLEHLHSYSYKTHNRQPANLLDMHTDMGLFILMTPALTLDKEDTNIPSALPTVSTGLFVQRRNGDVVFADSRPDSLILMIGQGFADWLAPRLQDPSSQCSKFRPMPHGVDLSQLRQSLNIDQGLVGKRGWYGRMFQLPDQWLAHEIGAVSSPEDTSSNVDQTPSEVNLVSGFDALTRSVKLIPAAFQIADSNGAARPKQMSLARGHRRHLTAVNAAETCILDGGSLGIQCWMQCMAPPTTCTADQTVSFLHSRLHTMRMHISWFFL